MQVSVYILLGITTAAAGIQAAARLPAQDITPSREDRISEGELVARVLTGRDVPPCIPCKKGRELSNDVPPEIEASVLEEAERSLTSRVTYPSTYVPAICNVPKVNCMYLSPNVKFIKGGLKPFIGHWIREDLSQVYAWNYWQSDLLFTGPGGSLLTYPAHCTIYTCVKGTMFAHIYDDNIDIKGYGLGNDTLNCMCLYHLDTDQYFGIQ